MYRRLREVYVHLRATSRKQATHATQYRADQNQHESNGDLEKARAAYRNAAASDARSSQACLDAERIEDVLDDWLDRLACEEHNSGGR